MIPHSHLCKYSISPRLINFIVRERKEKRRNEVITVERVRERVNMRSNRMGIQTKPKGHKRLQRKEGENEKSERVNHNDSTLSKG